VYFYFFLLHNTVKSEQWCTACTLVAASMKAPWLMSSVTIFTCPSFDARCNAFKPFYADGHKQPAMMQCMKRDMPMCTFVEYIQKSCNELSTAFTNTLYARTENSHLIQPLLWLYDVILCPNKINSCPYCHICQKSEPLKWHYIVTFSIMHRTSSLFCCKKTCY